MNINNSMIALAILIFVHCIIPATALSASKSLNWSFQTNPHPRAFHKSEQDLTDLLQRVDGQDDPKLLCQGLLEREWLYYLRHYPEFLSRGHTKQLRVAWGEHLVLGDYWLAAPCVIVQLFQQLDRVVLLLKTSQIIYCGRFSREPKSPVEQRFAGLLTKSLTLAGLGSHWAGWQMLRLHRDDGRIVLNHEIEYYLRRVVQQTSVHETIWDIRHLLPHISQARRRELDAAFERRDISTVLATTPTCLPDVGQSHLPETAPKSSTSDAKDQADLNWSFDQHPHPRLTEQSVEERTIWWRARRPADERLENCDQELAAEFEIYRIRYPQFAESGSAAAQYRGWKLHLVDRQLPDLDTCVLHLVYDRFDQLAIAELNELGKEDFEAPVLFCGGKNPNPKRPLQLQILSLIGEKLDYAQTGHPSALYNLLTIDLSLRTINLNPDVKYFIHRAIAQADPENTWGNIGKKETELTPQRRGFVDAAVANLDLQAVLDTTPDCPPTFKQ